MRQKNQGRFSICFKREKTPQAGEASKQEWLGAWEEGDQRAGRDETQRTAELGRGLV